VQLTLRDRAFQIEQATLSAQMQDPYWCDKWNGGVSWQPLLSLELQAAEVEYDGEIWSPVLSHDWLPFPSRDWRALANREVKWPEAAVTGPQDGDMYVFGHHDVYEDELVFGDRRGLEVDVSWHGLCDIFWDEEFGERVPFAATATTRFSAVCLLGCGQDDADTFLERFALYLNPDDFVQGAVLADGNRYADGMPMARCLFTPRVSE